MLPFMMILWTLRTLFGGGLMERWLVFPDEKTKKDFCEEQAARLARDSEGNICYMATSIYNLMTTQKHWPQVQFLTTREQGQKFE